ncbi:ribonuclease D [Haliangium sp.]|uniref:ribonuclease D n=1 Tax=Haliangium sp. TaxID=2663208 RepID=UPI003D0EA9A7
MTKDEQVRAIAAEITAAGSMAFDLEFASEGRYIPELSLLQVAWPARCDPGGGAPDPAAIAVIDCVAVDPGPILALLADPAVASVAHAARQDLSLVAARFGVFAQCFWDTQIAAAFVGMGEQIGYAKLVRALVGVSLAKDAHYSGWLQRPLSPGQLRYAADDVRYLPRLWTQLRARLEELGRLSWVGEESAALAATAMPYGPAEEAYLTIKGQRGLTEVEQARLRVLAAWRQQTALADNRPLSWVLPDKAMLGLCRRPASSPRDLRAKADLSGATVRRYGADIVAALERVEPVEPVEPVRERPHAASTLGPRAQVWSAVILGLIQSRASEVDIAARFVGTRADADAVAAWYEQRGAGEGAEEPPSLPLLQGWRRELVGGSILDWLRGQVGLRCTLDGPGAVTVATDLDVPEGRERE